MGRRCSCKCSLSRGVVTDVARSASVLLYLCLKEDITKACGIAGRDVVFRSGI